MAVTPDSAPIDNCQAGLPFDLNGTAGVLAIMAVHVNASGIVDAETTAELLILLDVDQTGQILNTQATICDLQIPKIPVTGISQPIEFIIDPAVVETVGQLTIPATLGGTTTCASMTTQDVTFLIGAKADPGSPLPTADGNGIFPLCGGDSCLDALGSNCACDQEPDGKPGATLDARNVPVIPFNKIYATVRARFALSGRVFSSDRVEGVIDATLEQGILGCVKDNDVACSPADLNIIIAFNPTITKSTVEPSTFVSARLPPATTCAQLRAMRDTLFP